MRAFGKNLHNIESDEKTLDQYLICQSQPTKLISRSQCHEPEKNDVVKNRLDSYDVQYSYQFTIETLSMREKLFKWTVAQCRITLELRNETIEHAMRLYDKYNITKGEVSNVLMQNQLTLISCMFISSKYEEIYPPVLTDFEYIGKYKFGGRDIIRRELQILETVDFELVITLASTWYNILYSCAMPEWGILCYPEFPTQFPIKNLAEAIRKIEQQGHSDSNTNESTDNVEEKINNVFKLVRK